MTEKQEEMLQQMIYLYNLFLNEVGEAIENLRQVKTRDWPARVYKDDVDWLAYWLNRHGCPNLPK